MFCTDNKLGLRTFFKALLHFVCFVSSFVSSEKVLLFDISECCNICLSKSDFVFDKMIQHLVMSNLNIQTCVAVIF